MKKSRTTSTNLTNDLCEVTSAPVLSKEKNQYQLELNTLASPGHEHNDKSFSSQDMRLQCESHSNK